MKSSDRYFKDSGNHFCWADCESLHDGCNGKLEPVLVFSDGKSHLMDLGEGGMPFFYCQEAIKRDQETGYRVEIVEVEA